METKISPLHIRAARIAACKKGLEVKKVAFDKQAPGFVSDLTNAAKEDMSPNFDHFKEFVERRIDDWKAYNTIIRQDTEIKHREKATNRNPILHLNLRFSNNE